MRNDKECTRIAHWTAVLLSLNVDIVRVLNCTVFGLLMSLHVTCVSQIVQRVTVSKAP